MAIIKFTPNQPTSQYALLNLYPNQFVSDREKETDGWKKINMDYFYNVAIQQYASHKDSFVRNYELVAGILRRSDFALEPELQSFTETLMQSEDLPAYVKHYCILTPPLNTLKGELNNKPDNVYVKAFDDDSKSEELQFRTSILNDFIFQNARERMNMQLAQQGVQTEDEDEINRVTAEKVEEYMTSYTSLAERWGAKMLEYMKMRFNMKEKSEEAFNDLLISAREYFHIYEDNTELGFNIEVLNPKNVWYITTPDTKYTSDPFDKTLGAYASGTIEIMEFSEIIHKFNLTQKEIEHLRSFAQQNYLLGSRESNLVNPNAKTGPDSVYYETYDPLVLQYRQLLEAEITSGTLDDTSDFLGLSSSAATFGNKYLVIRAYWCSKKKIGKLTYIDDDGYEQVTYVDESYKDKSHPQQLELEWTYINQWYKGVKIGLDVYYVEPFDMLDYNPIIGVLYEPKNLSKPTSFVDKMKHYQMLYNIAVNQLFRLLEKDMGVVFLMSQRHVPIPKDGAAEDALEIWEEEAREKGFIFVDDSPENLGSPSSFNQYSRVDLSRASEIQARYNLAVEIRNECWKLAGLTEQRLGSVAATETATGTNTALSQSYAQTEPYFAQHEYLINKVYQALLDAALYKQSQTEESILSNISSEGSNAFVKINGSDLKLRELGVFITSRSEDARNLQELRSLSQAMLQNGASPYEVSELFTSKSARHIKDMFKRLKDKQEAFEQQQQQIEQQKIEQSQQQFQQQQELVQLQLEKQQAFEAYQKEQDRLSKERIAYIQAASKADSPATTSDSELMRIQSDEQRAYSDYQLKLRDLENKQRDILTQNSLKSRELDLKKEELKVKREEMASKERIAKENRTASEIKAKRQSKK